MPQIRVSNRNEVNKFSENDGDIRIFFFPFRYKTNTKKLSLIEKRFWYQSEKTSLTYTSSQINSFKHHFSWPNYQLQHPEKTYLRIWGWRNSKASEISFKNPAKKKYPPKFLIRHVSKEGVYFFSWFSFIARMTLIAWYVSIVPSSFTTEGWSSLKNIHETFHKIPIIKEPFICMHFFTWLNFFYAAHQMFWKFALPNPQKLSARCNHWNFLDEDPKCLPCSKRVWIHEASGWKIEKYKAINNNTVHPEKK